MKHGENGVYSDCPILWSHQEKGIVVLYERFRLNDSASSSWERERICGFLKNVILYILVPKYL